MTLDFEALANCNRPQGEWTYQIKDGQGLECGHFRARILENESDLNFHFHFDIHGGFSGYRSQIPIDEIFPMALLDHIVIDEGIRNRGYGSGGLSHFYQQAKARGARCGFLRVSSNDEKWNRLCDNSFAAYFQPNICFYQKNGWFLLKNYGASKIPFMYHTLSTPA